MSWRDRGAEQDERKTEGFEAKGKIAGGASRLCTDEEKLKLNEIFSYHPPNSEQTARYEHIREAARHFAKVLLMNCPDGPDRNVAIRHIRDAAMTANSAVALNGLFI